MKRILLVLCAGLFFVPACATVGRDFDESRVPNIATGATTRMEIEQWFGMPNQRTTMSPAPNGAVLRYTYRYGRSTWGGASTKAKCLVVDFNDAGVVVDQGFSTVE